MRRETVLRALVLASRVVRWIGWTAAAIYAGLSFDGLHRMVREGPVGVGTSAFTIAELLAVLIVVLMYDRTWELVERQARDSQPR